MKEVQFREISIPDSGKYVDWSDKIVLADSDEVASVKFDYENRYFRIVLQRTTTRHN